MGLITPIIVILVFAVIITIALMACWVVSPSSYDSNRWKVFIITFAGLSIVMTFLFYYSIVELQQSQQKLTTISESQDLIESITNITGREMKDASKIIPDFVCELMPMQCNFCEDISSSNNSIEKITHVNSLSSSIFLVWQVVVEEKDFIIDEEGGYVSLFLQWANSEQLFKCWRLWRISLSDEARKFGDLIFKYGRKIKKKVPESYELMSKKLISCVEYNCIFC